MRSLLTIVPQTYVLLQHALLTEDDSRDSMFGNTVRSWGEVNQDLFKDTPV